MQHLRTLYRTGNGGVGGDARGKLRTQFVMLSDAASVCRLRRFEMKDENASMSGLLVNFPLGLK
jgi:hypothetical protein